MGGGQGLCDLYVLSVFLVAASAVRHTPVPKIREKVAVFLYLPAGSSFVVSEGSYLDISDWLNPAKLSLYYQVNATSPWVRDLCGQRTTDACEQLCDPETGELWVGLGKRKRGSGLEGELPFFYLSIMASEGLTRVFM